MYLTLKNILEKEPKLAAKYSQQHVQNVHLFLQYDEGLQIDLGEMRYSITPSPSPIILPRQIMPEYMAMIRMTSCFFIRMLWMSTNHTAQVL